MKPIPNEVLLALNSLGAEQDASTADPSTLEALLPYDAVNRLHFDSWYVVAETLDQANHSALARGLVIAEEALHWCGGSVAAAIWVFRSFHRKFPQASAPLAEWMLKHSTNPWVPFGTDRSNARSLSEYHKLQEAWERRKSESHKAAAQRELMAEERRSKRLRDGVERSQASKARGMSRLERFAQLESMPLKERLERIANDTENSLHYYEPRLLAGDFTALDTEGRDALKTLCERASAVHRGPWRKWLASCAAHSSPDDSATLNRE